MALRNRLLESFVLRLVLSLAAGVGVTSCDHAEAPRLVRIQPVRDVPADIAFFPHVYYGGEDAYLVDGRWFRPDADGWVVFTEEPFELELVRKSVAAKWSLFGGE